jgi:hypothetical protein
VAALAVAAVTVLPFLCLTRALVVLVLEVVAAATRSLLSLRLRVSVALARATGVRGTGRAVPAHAVAR